MKKLSIEQKAKAYDEAIERAKGVIEQNPLMEYLKKGIEYIFPELKESEGERIRKVLLGHFSRYQKEEVFLNNITMGDIVDWLEKQGEQKPAEFDDINAKRMFIKALERVEEQNNKGYKLTDCDKNSWWEDFKTYASCTIEHKPADKVEPKFHEGDWVFIEDVKGYKNGPFQIKVVDSFGYSFDEYYTIPFMYEELLSKWTIQDAKDGDVLASSRSIFIFSQEYIAGKPESHCGIMNGLFIVKPEGCWTNEKCYPATKEQRDALEKAITDAGWKFDFEKKELKKIEQKHAESRQETKPNGGIVCEDFNEGDGYYKVNLAYLSKSQVELIENLVVSWQNITNNTTEWSEDNLPEFESYLCLMFQKFRTKGICTNGEIIDYVNEHSQKLKDILCHAWSEEDIKMFVNIKACLRNANKSREVDWLMSLKPQPKQEWSKEDERNLNDAILFIETGTYSLDKDTLINWLKSLRPQNTWKPSDEQMHLLEELVEDNNQRYFYTTLKSLYEQLKKLKG